METLTLHIDGMSCGHCVGQVTKVLTQLDGVQVNSVRVGEAQMDYNRALITPSEIARAVIKAGYEVQPVGRAA